MISHYTISIPDEFNRKEAVYLERVSELEEITQKRDRARKRHDDLRKTRLNEFMEGFGIITAKLKEMYQVCCCTFWKLRKFTHTLLLARIS